MKRVAAWIRPRRGRERWVIIAFFFIDYAIDGPLDFFLPVDAAWLSNISRLVLAVLIVAYCARFMNLGREWFRLPRMIWWQWLVMLGVFGYFLTPIVLSGRVRSSSFWDFLDVAFFTLCIGIEEEFLCRGLVFQLYARYGMWAGIHYSAGMFGLFHLINIYYGAEVFPTVIQALSAVFIGYLLCAVMIYGRSIWWAVLMHAMTDLPYVSSTGVGQVSVSPTMAIVSFVATASVYLGFALALIWARTGWPRFVRVWITS